LLTLPWCWAIFPFSAFSLHAPYLHPTRTYHHEHARANRPEITMSIFMLPLELRYMTYRCALEDPDPFRFYQGLYLTCKEIKQEIEAEATKIWRLRVSSWKQNLPIGHGLDLQIPDHATFAQLRNLRLSLSTSVYKQIKRDSQPNLLSLLQPILDMTLDSLTLTFHEENGVGFECWHSRWIEDNIMGWAMSGSGVLRAEKVIIDLPAMARVDADDWWVGLRESKFGRRSSWKKGVWVVEAGPKTVMLFERKGSLVKRRQYAEAYVEAGLQREWMATRQEGIAGNVLLGVLFYGLLVDLRSFFV
jgi:hypothetical protein